MSLFSRQEVYCNACGAKFETEFHFFGGRFCGRDCNEEYEWKKTLSIMGKKYYPKGGKKNNERKV